MTDKPLATRPLQRNEWDIIMAVAPSVQQGRLWAGIANAGTAASIMLIGHDLGLPLSAAFQYVHIIDGKPSLSPQGALAVIRSSGLLEKIEIAETTTPVGCTVTMTRRGGESHSVRWTVADAERAGLVKPLGGWTKYPRQMCQWRAIGYCADYLFPDVLGGLKRADEHGAEIDEAGMVIDASWSAVPSPEPTEGGISGRSSFSPIPAETPAAVPSSLPAAAPPPETLDPYSDTMDELVERYGAERVLEVAGGIPATNEELAAVAVKLAGEAATP